jgi:hypothetical protein
MAGLDEFGKREGGALHVRALVFNGEWLAALEQRVSAERDDDPHRSTSDGRN